MSAMQTIALPRVLSDAVAVCANPKEYADRPTLMHLARLILMSASGQVPTQTKRRRKAAVPVLRAIRGGLQ